MKSTLASKIATGPAINKPSSYGKHTLKFRL